MSDRMRDMRNYTLRWSQVPERARQLALESAVLHNILEQYARYDSMSLEDALVNIIIAQAEQIKNRDAWIAREVALQGPPPFVEDVTRGFCRTCGDPVVYSGNGHWMHTTPGHNHLAEKE